MNIFNIICLILYPLPKVDKEYQKFCNEVLNQMKEIYNYYSKEYEYPINEPKIKNILNINDKNNNELKIKDNDITKSKNHKKSNKGIKGKKIINSNLTKSKKKEKIISLGIRQQNPNSNELILDNTNIDKSNNKINKMETQIIKEQKKDGWIVGKLKREDNSDFYIYNLIKYIPYKNRKTYLTETEIENLSYKDALQIETRNKANYYFSLLKEKNPVISIFLNNKDYNVTSVKISLFIFNFNFSLAINALFFDDEAIYEINQDNGSFNLSTQISRILLSALISGFIGYIAELFAFSQDSIIELRNYKDLNEAENKRVKLIKTLKIRYVLFFGIIILFNLAFFYYITAFCAIYSIIQTHMISDSMMSFLMTISYSIILSLISANFRISSLKKQNKIRHIFYFISWIIALL